MSSDLADQAINMIEQRYARSAVQPFFMYWATGAAHAPHHAPSAWIERFHGKFDTGWDKARDAILKEQKAQGLIPRQAVLAPRPEGMPAWDSLNVDQKRLYARQMEVFAASLSYADAQFGRILDTLEANGELDNTIVVVTSDNGASAEGSYNGLYNEAFLVTGQKGGVEDNLRFLDQWGGPQTYPHYSFGWAVAGNTPFRYFKQTTHEGGTRVPLVFAWPKGIAARGELRDQFAYVADIAPTILELAKVPLAETINNVKQSPMEGDTLTYSFASSKAPVRKQAQYFEMYGNKGLWSDGWSIVTTHRTQPWDLGTSHPVDEPWELYDLTSDPGQTRDLAARDPGRVQAMARIFEAQADRYHVNPIDNMISSSRERIAKAAQDFQRRRGKWFYPGPAGNLSNMELPPLLHASFTVTATLDLPAADVTAPIFALGGNLGGMGFYLRDGRPVFILRSLAGEVAEVVGSRALSPGRTKIALDFRNAQTSPGMLADHGVTILAAGQEIANTTLRFAIPPSVGISETFGIGIDNGSTVLPGAAGDRPFPGQLNDVVFQFAGSQ